MRIISGTARGRRLATPGRSQRVRPTSDRVREAIFSLVTARASLEGARVLDLFAGTGALGCEALSRGAASVVFVDNHRESLALVRENLKRIDIAGGQVIKGDAVATLARLTPAHGFDIVFLDPPYGDHRVASVLKALEARTASLLAPGALVCAEHGRDEPTPQPERLREALRRPYGDTHVALWTLPEEDEEEEVR